MKSKPGLTIAALLGSAYFSLIYNNRYTPIEVMTAPLTQSSEQVIAAKDSSIEKLIGELDYNVKVPAEGVQDQYRLNA